MIYNVLLTQKDKKIIARVCQYPEIVAEDESEEAVLTATRIKLNKLLSNSRIVKINVGEENSILIKQCRN